MKIKEIEKSGKRKNNVGLDKIKKKKKREGIEKPGNLLRSTAEFKTQEKKKKNIKSVTAIDTPNVRQNQNPSSANKKKIKKFKVIESEWQSSFVKETVTPVVSEQAGDNSPKKKRKKHKKRKSEEGVAVIEAKKPKIVEIESKPTPFKENGNGTESNPNEGERRKRKRKKNKKNINGGESAAVQTQPQQPEKKPQEPEKKKRKKNKQIEQKETVAAPAKKPRKHSQNVTEVTPKNISEKDTALVKETVAVLKIKKKARRHRKTTRRDESQVVQRIVIVENIPIKMMHNFKERFEERFSKYGKVHHIGPCEFDEATATKKFITTVIFHDAKTAKKALEEDNLPYEGNRLIVRKANEAKDTTLVVRKLKEYNEKVIRSIFTPCGSIRRVSCVKKPEMDNSTVFVEFWKPESIKEALKVAEDVKIGGRKLLLGIYKSTKPEPRIVSAN